MAPSQLQLRTGFNVFIVNVLILNATNDVNGKLLFPFQKNENVHANFHV